jgi:hypothetical protein
LIELREILMSSWTEERAERWRAKRGLVAMGIDRSVSGTKAVRQKDAAVVCSAARPGSKPDKMKSITTSALASRSYKPR